MFYDLQLIVSCYIAIRNEIYKNFRRILDISNKILELLFGKFRKEFLDDFSGIM